MTFGYRVLSAQFECISAALLNSIGNQCIISIVPSPSGTSEYIVEFIQEVQTCVLCCPVRTPHLPLATRRSCNGFSVKCHREASCMLHPLSDHSHYFLCCGSVVLFSVSPSSLLMAPYSCPASVVDENVLASMPQFFVVYLSPIQPPPRADPLRSACSLCEHDVGLNGWV